MRFWACGAPVSHWAAPRSRNQEPQGHLPRCGRAPTYLWKATLRVSSWVETMDGKATGHVLLSGPQGSEQCFQHLRGRRAAQASPWAPPAGCGHIHPPGSCLLVLEEAASQPELPGLVLGAQEAGLSPHVRTWSHPHVVRITGHPAGELALHLLLAIWGLAESVEQF